MASSGSLVFFCNGIKVEENVDPEMSLLTYLRTKLRLTGSHAGCGEGGCGACTVMVSSVHPKTKVINHLAVMACLFPLCRIDGKAVTTIEGIGNVRSRLHVLQESLAKNHGTQCGFCSPGMVMSMYSLLRTNPKPCIDEVLKALEGNLCRCTGYRPILDSFKIFCENTLHDSPNHILYDQTQEPIFPPELLMQNSERTRAMRFGKGRVRWVVTSSLQELLQHKEQFPSAQIIFGNTLRGIQRSRDDTKDSIMLSLGPLVTELTHVTSSETGVTFGSGVTMTQLESELDRLIEELPEHQTRTLSALKKMSQQHSNQQIRNVATLGGTIAGFSKCADHVPVLRLCGTTVTLAEVGGERILQLDEMCKTETGIIMKDTEMIKEIFVPFTKENEFCYAHKISQRRRHCLATVNSGCFVVMDTADNTKIRKITVLFGGENSLGPLEFKERSLDQNFLGEALATLSSRVTQEVHPPDSDLNSVEFKSSLMSTCLFRSLVTLYCKNVWTGIPTDAPFGSYLSDDSLTSDLTKSTLSSTQLFQPAPLDQPDMNPVGRPLLHMSAFEQCTGEAMYVDDIPPVDGELSAAPVLSIRPHAKLVSVDPAHALALPGVIDFISHKDVPASNCQILDPLEECFVSSEVHAVGQTIGLVIARDRHTALRAATLVQVEYQELDQVITTLEDAIKFKSYLTAEPRVLTRGDLDAGMQNASSILEGEFHIGGQDHVYMEPRVCIAKPLERDGMDITVTSQNLHHVQMNVAHCLGVPASRVVCRTPRLGGGFGGKDHRIQYALVTAVAAQKTGKPVRLCLERKDDTLMKGFRTPFLAKYRSGFTTNGRITALDLELFADCGWSLDLSDCILMNALVQLDSVYSLENFRVTGRLCKTNKPSSTAMRGFGLPQGQACVEHVISDIALACDISPREAREINFKCDGEAMYPGEKGANMTIVRKCWDMCLQNSNFVKKEEEILAFNRENRWKKRGIAVVPTRQGIGYSEYIPLNQGAALVHIYTDGSVLVNHGGVEMGQGLNTKCLQIASGTLGIPASKINIIDASTDRTPNTTPTSASTGTQLFGSAVKIACDKLLMRLQPFKEINADGTWEEWVFAAYSARVNLSATGFYKEPDITWSWDTKSGNPFNHYTYGAAVSEVEVDVLTGEHCVLRTDIVMEIGRSINPALDVGQIEGAFVQGYGYFVMERLKFSPEGALLSPAPNAYKIPLASDIPAKFNVTLLRDTEERINTIYSSKAIGEPPLFLAISVFFAIKEAILSARSHLGLSGPFRFDIPADVQAIRTACGFAFMQ
ncbi:xanthine dehydrogenase/oxidase-like [Diadema antillarum]|uniref:xanthine dehydrogenase/oxidase-like n=1 Tax=Diadema antillarum TaxID=105358 RepID=UPI003A8B04F1